MPAAQAAAFGVGGGPFAAGPMQTGMFGTSVCPGAVGQSGNGAASSGQMPTVQVRAPEMHPTGSPFSRTPVAQTPNPVWPQMPGHGHGHAQMPPSMPGQMPGPVRMQMPHGQMPYSGLGGQTVYSCHPQMSGGPQQLWAGMPSYQGEGNQMNDLAMARTLASMPPQEAQLWMQIMMMREMRRMRPNGDESCVGVDGNETTLRRGFAGIMAMRRRFVRDPLSLIQGFESRVKEELGVTDPRMAWCYKEYSRRLRPTFGKMAGLWRCHRMMMELIQGLAAGDGQHSHAFAVQCAKALHQVALDHGSWQNATYLVPTPDPLGRQQTRQSSPRSTGIVKDFASCSNVMRKGLPMVRTKATRRSGPVAKRAWRTTTPTRAKAAARAAKRPRRSQCRQQRQATTLRRQGATSSAEVPQKSF